MALRQFKLFCAFLAVSVAWLEGATGAKATICDDVSMDIQNACRDELRPGQYPPYMSIQRNSMPCSGR